jgi:hypothetical protein
MFEGALHGEGQLVLHEGLREVVVGPETHGLDGLGDLDKGGEDDDAGERIDLPDLGEGLETPLLRHHEIQQHHRGVLAAIGLHRLRAVGDADDAHAFGGEDIL